MSGSIDAAYMTMLAFAAMLSFGLGLVAGMMTKLTVAGIESLPPKLEWATKFLVSLLAFLTLGAFVASYGLDGLYLLVAGFLKQLIGQASELNFVAIFALVAGVALTAWRR